MEHLSDTIFRRFFLSFPAGAEIISGFLQDEVVAVSTSEPLIWQVIKARGVSSAMPTKTANAPTRSAKPLPFQQLAQFGNWLALSTCLP